MSEERTVSSTPAQAAIAPVQIRRRRRWPFFLALAVLIPTGLYFGAWYFINKGALTSTIEQRISDSLGGTAHVGHVHTDALQNIRLQNITLEPSSHGPTSTVDEITAEWDTRAFLASGRMKSVTVQRPHIELRVEPAGWNFKMRSAANKELSFKADRLAIHEGLLNIEYGTHRGPRLSEVEALYHDFDGAQPGTFTLIGTLESAQQLTLEGTEGPGSGFTAHLKGGVSLERDIAELISPANEVKGQILLDLTAERAARSETGGEGDATFCAALGLSDFEMLVDPHARCMLKVPNTPLWLRGIVVTDLPAIGGNTKPALAAAVRNVSVKWPGVGAFTSDANLLRAPALHAAFEDGTATFDLQTLTQYFHPLPKKFKVSGAASLTKMKALLPLENGAPPSHFEAQVSLSKVLLNSPTLGSPPPFELTGALDWPKASNVVLNAGPIGTVEFDSGDLSGLFDLNAALQTTHIHRFNMDVAAMLGCEWAKSILGGTGYGASGHISGDNVQAQWFPAFSLTGQTKLFVTGLALDQLQLSRWPGSAPPPPTAFSGPFTLEVDFDKGVPYSLMAAINLKGAGATTVACPVADLVNVKPMKAQPDGMVTFRFDWEKDSGWKPVFADAEQFMLPLANADAFLHALGLKDVVLGGSLSAQKLKWNGVNNSFEGKLRLNSSSIRAPITKEQRDQAVQVLESLNRSVLANLLRSMGVLNGIEFSKLDAEANISTTPDSVQVEGKTFSADFGVVLPIVGSYKVANVPGVTYRIRYDDPALDRRRIQVDLDSAGHELSLTANSLSASEWTLRGILKLRDGATMHVIHFDGPLNEGTGLCGPLRIEADTLGLAQLGPLFGLPEGGNEALKGEIRKPQILVEPFEFSKGMPPRVSANVSGAFVQAAFKVAGYAFEKLDGPLAFKINALNDRVDIEALTTLTSFAALLRDSTPAMPLLPDGKTCEIRLKGSLPRPSAPGTPAVAKPASGIVGRIDSCTLNLGSLVTAEWSGELHYEIGGGVRQLEIKKATVSVPDLLAACAYVVPPIVLNREPRFGDLKLTGGARYEGSLLWEAGALSAVDGAITLNGVDFHIGTTDPFDATGINGAIPVLWRANLQPQREGGPHGTVTLGRATFSRLVAGKQELQVENSPSGLVVRTPIKFTAPGVELSAANLEIGNSWSAGAPMITFLTTLRVDADAILKNEDITFPGLRGCVLEGPAFECAIRRSAAPNAPWEFVTGTSREYKGGPLLNANFYGGKLVLADLHGRGLFTPNATLGFSAMAVGKSWPDANEGFNIQGILDHFPQYGQFNTRLSLYANNIETTALNLHAVQHATLKIESAPANGDEYWYDGNFAAALDWEMLRSSFPSFFSDESIRKLSFGVRQLGLSFDLQNSTVTGPKPLLRGGYILRGYGAESNPFAKTFKKDLPGDMEVQLSWDEVLRSVKQKLDEAARRPARLQSTAPAVTR